MKIKNEYIKIKTNKEIVLHNYIYDNYLKLFASVSQFFLYFLFEALHSYLLTLEILLNRKAHTLTSYLSNLLYQEIRHHFFEICWFLEDHL